MTNDTSTNPRRTLTQDNEQERILDQWKKLYHETEMLIDAMTWTGPRRGHKDPLEVMLWDLSKLIARLEQGLK
jgi:hypothetical protein